MEFRLNGGTYSLDAETVRFRLRSLPPGEVRTHWVEIDGQSWPVKHAFRVSTGLVDEPFTSHFAVAAFRRLGFRTSRLPKEVPAAVGRSLQRAQARPTTSEDESLAAYRRLDRFLSATPLTELLARLEARLEGADRRGAQATLEASGFSDELIDSSLIVRERIGMLDSLVHAAVITHVIPLILEDDEHVLRRPSLGAGNDPERVFDLETTHRVAEFKLSSWKGSDGMRQRGLFADVVGLSLDRTDRRREVYVVGTLPVRFLTESKRNAARTLSKAAIRIRSPRGLSEAMTVAEYTRQARVDVIDLTSLLPELR
ncbi:PE-PGRS family protein [Aeromicrobium sp. 636]|uniref:PE-PGRS family protein n=1 Tax=Aeromicrobium senzhongii TaxID=2663859 RepID=A0A8I0ESZ1_9ACTN|nr:MULTISPECIES: PE-PGRS family protein [Aeromicrobium]MBC9225871.1 PE-PGRS family protein [Aeromicrobium senzhongii]MCQ3997978.1 PE-PGRS family protein [Aeromicrobium sp. 636]